MSNIEPYEGITDLLCCAKLSLIELVGNMDSLCADMMEISLCADMMEITTELVTQAEALGRLDVW